jgi:membrane fusion protein (multidrug efflux system)
MKQIGIGLAAGLAITILLGTIKYFQISAAIAQQMAMGQPPTAVNSVVVKEDSWESYVNAIGTLTAVQGTILAAEIPGKVTSIQFKSGDYVEAGATLIELDTSVELANLAGAKASGVEAQKMLERARLLRKRNANSEADLDAAVARSAEAQAQIAVLERTIEKKTIIAPFAGFTGIRKVNVGQYVNEGTEIVPLFALKKLYVDFSLPQSTLGLVKKGARVQVTTSESSTPTVGMVKSLDPNIDPQTRNYGVRAVIDNADDLLRPGMFVDVAVDTGLRKTIIPIPQASIVYAPYGDSVWIIETHKADDGSEKKSATQQFVKLGDTRGDYIAVTSGLKPGMEIVSSGGFKLHPGATVIVNNSVTPTASESPQPANS